MLMTLNERDIVYIFNHNTNNVEQCRVVAKDFGEDDQCLLYGLSSESHFVAAPIDMYESAEICLQEEARKIDEGYMTHYETFDSMEMVVLHALYAAMTGTKLDNLEIQALVHRASEFMRVDIRGSLDKYVKSMEKESGKKTKKKEGFQVA
jgi:hypothetical protein